MPGDIVCDFKLVPLVSRPIRAGHLDRAIGCGSADRSPEIKMRAMPCNVGRRVYPLGVVGIQRILSVGPTPPRKQALLSHCPKFVTASKIWIGYECISPIQPCSGTMLRPGKSTGAHIESVQVGFYHSTSPVPTV